MAIAVGPSSTAGGTSGEGRTPSTGLRQGCPLSATLVGLFIDGLHHYLETMAPAAGIQIQHMRLREIVYADDICLMASLPEHLQAVIDALSSYCAILHMEISVPKTEIMVVSLTHAPAVAFSCNDNPIEQVTTFKYLSLHFHQSGAVVHLISPIKSMAGGSGATPFVPFSAHDVHSSRVLCIWPMCNDTLKFFAGFRWRVATTTAAWAPHLRHVDGHLPNHCGTLQDEFAPIHVYVLENTANGRCYVGQATDLSTRFAQHKRKPPTRMAADAARHVPFEQYFHMSDLGIVFGKAAADCAEAEHIGKYAATAPEAITLCAQPQASLGNTFPEKTELRPSLDLVVEVAM
ncbi:TPA: hypothetical protein ACH3X1_016723 [Trebouxia sp. C0004]